MIIFTKRFLGKHQGRAFWFLVLVHPDLRDSPSLPALVEHEKTHGRQFRNHPVKYIKAYGPTLFDWWDDSPEAQKAREEFEVEAYKVQCKLDFNPGQYASYLANDYGLNIPFDEAYFKITGMLPGPDTIKKWSN